MFHYHAADRLLLVPPFFAFGIVISFLVPFWIVVLIAFACLFGIWVSRILVSLFDFVLWIFLPILLGICIGIVYYSVYYEKTPIPQIIKDIPITGKIIGIQDNADTSRIILKIDNNKKHHLPNLVRLNISKADYHYLYPNDTITVRAFLAPPAKALFEGAYDFEFYAKLHGFGATGRISQIITHTPAQTLSLSRYIHDIRLRIAQNILKNLPIETASPTVAMITGSRFNMPPSLQQAWKSSGIYHLLSISGLHMTIVAGICFTLLRYGLLCIPALAHGGKVKKITALCVIPLAYGYVLLSGGDVPVMRSYIMVCVGLVAVLCNQRMITLRSACVAFCLVLLINPIDIFNIGFALSFAAVFGIVIAVNFIAYLKHRYSLSKISNFMIVNICAGYAGLPLALYIFNSNAVLGLFTNMIAVPLTSFMIMPLMVLSLVTMLFGWHHYPLIAVVFGMNILNQLSLWIAKLPYAMLYQQSPWLIWIIAFYISIYLLAVNTHKSIKIGIIMLVGSIIGHSVSPRRDYLYITSENTRFYINKNNDLIKLVPYDKSYVNPYLTEQVLLHFGRNPQSVYYYEKCRYHKTYVTFSGKHFQCGKRYHKKSTVLN
jgi:competence protein ComEC